MAYRSDLNAIVAREAALEAEVRTRTRELDDTRRLVEDLKVRARLPVLDNLRVAAPCPASWDAMVGDNQVRACLQCQQNVYNLSEMTRNEAEALLSSRDALCLRYYQRSDGTILLKDCTVGVKRRRRRRVVAAGLAASLVGSGFAYLQAGSPSASSRVPGSATAAGIAIAPAPSQSGFVHGLQVLSTDLLRTPQDWEAEPQQAYTTMKLPTP